MRSRKPEPGDERNSSFEVPASVLEDLKPGLVYGEEKTGGAAKSNAPAVEDSHRRERHERKDIPTEPLAKRIRKTQKGG
jgi:hypothetical protein